MISCAIATPVPMPRAIIPARSTSCPPSWQPARARPVSRAGEFIAATPLACWRWMPIASIEQRAMAKKDFRFVHRLRVRWAEVDRQGIVFNGHYLTYFDVGVTEY